MARHCLFPASSHLVNGHVKAADTEMLHRTSQHRAKNNVSLASRRADSEVRSYKLKLYSLAVYDDGPVSLWVGCVRLCMCTGTCVYVCVCACMYVCMCACARMYVYVHVCMAGLGTGGWVLLFFLPYVSLGRATTYKNTAAGLWR